MALPAALATFAASNPELWGILKSLGIRGLTALGGYGITKLVGSPEEEALKQNLSMIGRLQPEYLNLLQKQMAGQPTAASAAIRGQVAQTSRAGQQSLAASSRRAGQGGTEVARANQARFLAAMAAEEQRQLGKMQLAAQQQVGALTGEARQVQTALAAQEGQELQQLTAYLAQGVFDDEIRRLMQQIVDAYTKQAGQGAALATTAPYIGPDYGVTTPTVGGMYQTQQAQGWQNLANLRSQVSTSAGAPSPEIPLEEGGTVPLPKLQGVREKLSAPAPYGGIPRPLMSVPKKAITPEVSPEEEHGVVSIMSPSAAGASVYVDDKYRIHANSTFRLPPGKHVISVRKPGYQPWSVVVYVSAGKVVELSPELIGGE